MAYAAETAWSAALADENKSYRRVASRPASKLYSHRAVIVAA